MGFFNSFTSFNMNMFGGFCGGFNTPFMSFTSPQMFSNSFFGMFSNWSNPFNFNCGIFNNTFSYTPTFNYNSSIWQSGISCNTTGTFRFNPCNIGGFSSGTSIFNNSTYGNFKYNATYTPSTSSYSASNPFSITSSNSTNKTKSKSKTKKSNKSTSTGVGNAKTRTEYANRNKRINAGKLKNLPAFQDNTGRAEMCNPAVVDTLADLAREAQRRGYRIVVSSSFRTTADQQRLRKTRGAYGKGGFAAAPGTSPHEFGQAIDFQVWKGNKKITIGKSTTPWVLSILSKHNMVWGGTFSTREPWHFNTANAKSYRSQLA